MSEPDYFDFDEAVQYIMKSQRVSRRRASRMLLAALRSGKLKATGENIETSKRETIPSDAWPGGPLS